MWPSTVINLAGNTGRMARSAATLDAAGVVGWQRLEGVDGRGLSDAEVAAVYDAEANRGRAKYPLVRPEIGCYLSHVAAWRRIAEGEADGGFVFEDDLVASPDLGAVLESLSADPAGWDMVKLFSFEPDPPMRKARPLGPGHRIGIPYRVPTCLLGYGLTRDAARRLAARALPFFRPVDEDQKFFWETGLRVALVVPQPIAIGDQEAATGTIGEVRRKTTRERAGSPLARLLRAARYQGGYQLRLHYHRLIGTGE